MARPDSDKSTNVRLLLLRMSLKSLARVSPRAAARVLERLFLRVRRHPVPDREHEWLRSATSFELASQGTPLAAWSWGEGPTVLLAHGWEGRGSQMGAFAGPLVAAGFRVVTFDAPGHGRSEAKRSSIVEIARAIEDVGRGLGRLRGIVAHSAGAAASAVAMSRGLEVDRLVFLAPPTELERFFEEVTRLLGLPERVARCARERIETRLGVEWESLRVLPIARHMSAPLLVVHDEHDREVAIAHGESLASAWPGGRLETTRGLGHRRILRDPEVVAKAVRFLAESDACAAATTRSRASAGAAPSSLSSFA